ncbi:MAG: MoaD/ThiS family protein [Desulfobacula sp.]|nr:MoaD/ThiS family protein [Desulfobacula sp.]
MTISITIPVTHWGYTKGKKKICAEKKTLADALSHLHRLFPDIDGHIVDVNNRLHPGIEMVVNEDLIFPFNPWLVLKPGDQVRISSIITGG